MFESYGMFVFCTFLICIGLLALALIPPVLQVQLKPTKGFSTKMILIAIFLVVFYYAFFSPHADVSFRRGWDVVFVVPDVLGPIFAIFSIYFAALGFFFPERYLEYKQKKKQQLLEHQREMQEKLNEEKNKDESNKK